MKLESTTASTWWRKPVTPEWTEFWACFLTCDSFCCFSFLLEICSQSGLSCRTIIHVQSTRQRQKLHFQLLLEEVRADRCLVIEHKQTYVLCFVELTESGVFPNSSVPSVLLNSHSPLFHKEPTCPRSWTRISECLSLSRSQMSRINQVTATLTEPSDDENVPSSKDLLTIMKGQNVTELQLWGKWTNF